MQLIVVLSELHGNGVSSAYYLARDTSVRYQVSLLILYFVKLALPCETRYANRTLLSAKSFNKPRCIKTFEIKQVVNREIYLVSIKERHKKEGGWSCITFCSSYDSERTGKISSSSHGRTIQVGTDALRCSVS